MAYTLLRGEVRGGEKLGFSKVRGRNFHSWRWSDLWNSTISNMFVVTVISVNMSNSPKTFSEQLQDLLNNTGTSVDEAIKALKDMKGQVGCFVIRNVFLGFRKFTEEG